MDEDTPLHPDDPLALLAKQDLTPMSVHELDERVIALEMEMARTKAHKARSVNHKASAEALFKS
ncbi:MAG: DUF1192 domain-containing protein [Sphingopyxis sp.]